jgi:hypothetical protein
LRRLQCKRTRLAPPACASRRLRRFGATSAIWLLCASGQQPRVRPNPSLEPTRSGKAHWPPRAQYHVALVGQWALPPRSAQLKR